MIKLDGDKLLMKYIIILINMDLLTLLRFYFKNLRIVENGLVCF